MSDDAKRDLDSDNEGKPADWDGFFAALTGTDVPDDFLSEDELHQPTQDRDPFAGWRE